MSNNPLHCEYWRTSGVGKTSVLRALLERIERPTLVTTTSRQKRSNERDGVDYFFVTEKEFKERIAAGRLLEYYYFPQRQAYYGVEWQRLKDLLAQQVLILSAIEVHGWRALRATYPEALGIYLLPENEDQIRQQYLARDPRMSPEALAERLAASAAELAEGKPEYVIHVVNAPNRLEKTIDEVYATIAKIFPQFVQ